MWDKKTCEKRSTVDITLNWIKYGYVDAALDRYSDMKTKHNKPSFHNQSSPVAHTHCIYVYPCICGGAISDYVLLQSKYSYQMSD